MSEAPPYLLPVGKKRLWKGLPRIRTSSPLHVRGAAGSPHDAKPLLRPQTEVPLADGRCCSSSRYMPWAPCSVPTAVGSLLRHICVPGGIPVTPTHLCLARARCACRADWMVMMASSCAGLPSAWAMGLGTRGTGELWGARTVGKTTVWQPPAGSRCSAPGTPWV